MTLSLKTAPKTILVVEDDAMILKMVGRALADQGFEILTAKSAGDALRAEAEYSVCVRPTQVIRRGQQTSGRECDRRLEREFADLGQARRRRGNPLPALRVCGRIRPPKESRRLSVQPPHCRRAANSCVPARQDASSSPPGCWTAPLRRNRNTA